MMSFQTKLYNCPFCEFVDDSDIQTMRHIITAHKALVDHAREEVCDVYYPPICDQLIDRGQKCYYGTHGGIKCPPKGELVCVCSGDHLEIENCRDCPKYNDCDLNFTVIREETP